MSVPSVELLQRFDRVSNEFDDILRIEILPYLRRIDRIWVALLMVWLTGAFVRIANKWRQELDAQREAD